MKTSILLITAAMLFTTSTMRAQTTATAPLGKTSFGFRAGVNFQNFNGKNSDGSAMKNNLVTRWNAGINLEIPVATDFNFQPGLLFTTKGAMKKQDISGGTMTATVNLSYIELPLNLVYKPLLGTGHLILGFGPYVAYGIGGNAKYSVIDSSGSNNRTEKVQYKSKVEAGDRTDRTYFKGFDAGANLMFGYEFSNRLSFQLNVQLGLVNINPSYYNIPNDKSVVKNTGFGLSLGYRL